MTFTQLRAFVTIARCGSVKAAALEMKVSQAAKVRRSFGEFDRQTGKISDSDYEPLKARYTEQALAVMRAGNAPVQGESAGCAPSR